MPHVFQIAFPSSSVKKMGNIGEENGEILIYIIYEKNISTEMGL